MAKKRTPSTVHATIRAEHNWSSGFGHVQVFVYDLFGYSGPTLKISSQTGGEYHRDATASYAWQHGLSNDHSVIGLEALRQGYYLMKRIDDRMAKKDAEYGRPRTFADYAVRVLAAAGVPVAHVLEPVNARLSVGVNFTSLPGLHPERNQLELVAALERMEGTLLGLAKG